MNRAPCFPILLLMLPFSGWCQSAKDVSPGEYLAKPDEIKIDGNIRRESIATPMGRVEMRWPRSCERIFGRTPERAVADAMVTASKALRRGGFPPELQRIADRWQIVFLDEELPEKQIPVQLVSNCHPAWMTGPANIYVVGQRVVNGCSERKRVELAKADAELTKVLLHEIGHVIEYHMMRGAQGGDPARSEGFATWFAQYSSDSSTILTRGEMRRMNFLAARKALTDGHRSKQFGGTFHDYAVASLVFSAIVDRKGVFGLVEVYNALVSSKSSLAEAIEKKLYWDEARLGKEITRLLNTVN